MLKRLLLVLALVAVVPGCVVYDGYYAGYPSTEMVWVSGATYYRDIYVAGEVHRHYYVWHPVHGYVYRSRVVMHGRFQ